MARIHQCQRLICKLKPNSTHTLSQAYSALQLATHNGYTVSPPLPTSPSASDGRFQVASLLCSPNPSTDFQQVWPLLRHRPDSPRVVAQGSGGLHSTPHWQAGFSTTGLIPATWYFLCRRWVRLDKGRERGSVLSLELSVAEAFRCFH